MTDVKEPPKRRSKRARSTDSDGPVRLPVRLDVVEGAVGFHLRRAQTFILDDLGRRMGTLELKPREYTVLSVIQANPGINAERIAEALPMKPSNLSVLLASLKKREVIRRADGASFGGVYAIFLTERGEALLAAARRLHTEHLNFVESVLGDGGMACLIEALRKLGDYRP
jgi:DNA-binding MarR family transcriptional regulator